MCELVEVLELVWVSELVGVSEPSRGMSLELTQGSEPELTLVTEVELAHRHQILLTSQTSWLLNKLTEIARIWQLPSP